MFPWDDVCLVSFQRSATPTERIWVTSPRKSTNRVHFPLSKCVHHIRKRFLTQTC